MNRIISYIGKTFAGVTGRVRHFFHKKGAEFPAFKDGFNYVHPYDPFYQEVKKRKRSQEVKLDEFEMSAFHDMQ